MRKIIYILLIFFSILLTSCRSTRYITLEIPVETTKTEYITNIVIDSIYVKDSIDRSFRNDTLIIYKEKLITKYKYKADTLIVRDTIPVITQVPIEIESTKLPWYKETLMYIGILALAYIGILLLIKYLKK